MAEAGRTVHLQLQRSEQGHLHCIQPKAYRYRSRRPDDDALRRRLRELAAERRRFGYRRLLILLRREVPVITSMRWKSSGIGMSIGISLCLHRYAACPVETGASSALGTRAPMVAPPGVEPALEPPLRLRRPERRASMRVLVVVDDFSWGRLALGIDSSLSGRRVARSAAPVSTGQRPCSCCSTIKLLVEHSR